MEVFGDLLKGFRLRRGRNQQWLANKLGKHRNTISDWERAEYLPDNREMVLAISNVLGLSNVETDELLFAANYPLEYQSKNLQQASVAQFKEVSAETIYAGQLKVASGPTSLHQPTRCDFYQHISLPQIYVRREDVLREVREVLLGEAPIVALTPVLQYTKLNALHGMGGIGKSVIARALCNDSEVQARFPDGILWMTLGQTPEFIPKMREWVHALGGSITENAPTVDRLKVALAKLLEKRACLLILDDVWQIAHAEVFQVGGLNCRLLLTTRDAEIAHEVGARIQAIPSMTESEAIALLEEWASGQLHEVDHELKQRIVKRLGHLPLAVKLAGAQLRHKHPEEWLRSFTIHKLKTPRANARNAHESLEQTFRLSLTELDETARHLYVALAIFKEEEPILQSGIERLWQGLSGLDSGETVDLLNDLAARALLQVDLSKKVILHDLLHDFIITVLKDRTIETHQAILSAYRTTWCGAGWHTAEDDGYLYDHLAYHLHSAREIDEIKGLFANQQWMQKRVPQQGYTYDGYLSDLAIALKCAEIDARQQIEAGQGLSAFADCVRYLLIRTSINSIANNYAPELIGRAIELGLWKPLRALSVAAKIPVETEKVRMYLAILKANGLSSEQQREAQYLALEATLAIVDEREQARVLRKLAPHLTGERLEQALEAALAMAHEWGQAGWVLEKLAPHLTREMLERRLEAALALESEWRRAWVLAELVRYLTGQDRARALKSGIETALAITYEEEQARVLERLAPYLTGELLEATLAVEGEEGRARILEKLVPHLTGELHEQAIQVTLAMKEEQWRARILARLTPDPTRELIEQAFKAALAIKEEGHREGILAELTPNLTGEDRAEAVKRGFEAALAIEVEERRARALEELMPHVTEELLEQALKATLDMEEEWNQAGVLKKLMPHLTGELLERALQGALAINEKDLRAEVLEELMPHLTGELLEQGLEKALAIKDEWSQARALSNLGPHLTGEDRAKGLSRGIEGALALKEEELE